MFEISGRILTIVRISDKSAKVILKKQVKGKQVAIAIDVYGFWKEKMDALNLNPKDKIQGKVYIKSNIYKGRWYSDVYFNEIKRYEAKPKWNANLIEPKQTPSEPEELFNDENIGNNYIVDEETGEILL